MADPQNPLSISQAGSVQAGQEAYGPRGHQSSPDAAPGTFARLLDQAEQLRFSNHAMKRLESRQIDLSDDGLQRLVQAVDKASQRGGQESLVLMENLAFIVNVRDRVVVTAVDMNKNGEGVFTQIDTVVVADGPKPPGLDLAA